MSFIDETLPPGYHHVAPVRETGRWQIYAGGDCVGYAGSPREACRFAWRHWTATVLRGRVIEWDDDDNEDGDDTHRCSIGHSGPFLYVQRGFSVSLQHRWGEEPIWQAFKAEIDIDEAVVRFAALVLAMKGMPV